MSSAKATASESQVSREEKRDYIKVLIQTLESQKSYTLLPVTFSVGFLAVFVNGLVFSGVRHNWPPLSKALLMAAASGMAVAGVLYFVWLTALQSLIIRAVDLLVTLDIEEARRVHYPGEEYWLRWRWIHYGATIAFVIGLGACIAFLYTQIS